MKTFHLISDGLREMGLPEPQTLEEWADVDLGQHRLPWLQGQSYAVLQRGISYFLLDNRLNKARRASGSTTLQTMLSLLRKPLHWRIRHHYFRLPLELWLAFAKEWLVVRRSLLTGDPLSRSLGKAG